jgi:folylpolyglutamate synthase/dihydropteroate synthase
MIDHWLVPQLMDSRAMSLSNLKVFLSEVGLVDYFSSTREAVTEFFQASSVGDRCVVFGSFVTVGSVQADMEKYLNESFI